MTVPDPRPLLETFTLSYTPVAGHTRLYEYSFATHADAKEYGESMLRTGMAQSFTIHPGYRLGTPPAIPGPPKETE